MNRKLNQDTWLHQTILEDISSRFQSFEQFLAISIQGTLTKFWILGIYFQEWKMKFAFLLLLQNSLINPNFQR